MTTNPLTLRIARQHVERFQDEAETRPEPFQVRDHDEAIDCFDCEAFLQLGIDAFAWIVRADETIRHAVFSGAFEDHSHLVSLCFQAWLTPVPYANSWIAACLDRGFDVDNLDEFRECERQVRAIVASLDSSDFPESLRDCRQRAVTEHENGETAEFA